MRVIGFSAILTLALAGLVSGSLPMYSKDCSYCPSCVTEVTPIFRYQVMDICHYCLCENGVPTMKKCEDHQEYNPIQDKCVPSDRCPDCCDDCCKNQCPICYHGIDFPIKNPKDKCQYCLCGKDGEMYHEHCPCGFSFNENTHDCDIRDPDCGGECCEVTCYGNNSVELHYENKDDPSGCSFCCCKPGNSSVFVAFCPFGEHYINGDCVDTGKKCQHSHSKSASVVMELRSECEDIVCPSNFKKAPLYPIAGDPGSYCKCEISGQAYKQPCKQGKVFSDKRQTCF